MTRPPPNSTARARRCRKRKREGKAAAARSRRYRQRLRNGNLLVHFEINEVGLLELLRYHGRLSSCGGDNRDVINAALKELVEKLIDAVFARHNA